MEREGDDDSAWRGDLHKSLLLLDERKIRPNDDNVRIAKQNENKSI